MDFVYKFIYVLILQDCFKLLSKACPFEEFFNLIMYGVVYVDDYRDDDVKNNKNNYDPEAYKEDPRPCVIFDIFIHFASHVPVVDHHYVEHSNHASTEVVEI